VCTLAKSHVLVTGAEGFIGSHLVEMLVAEGAHVTSLVQYNSFNSWGWLERSDRLRQMQVVMGDIRDAHLMLDLTKDQDFVLNLAALIAIPYSYRAPDSYIDTNIKGTLNLCQAALRHRVKRFVQVSTSEVYGTARYVPIDETHPLCGQSPYSASKIGADASAMSFYYSFDLPVVIARPFNAYGPRQSARAVIPTILSQLMAGKTEVKLGDLSTTRDFTYVEDTCAGILAIANMEGGCGEVFHIGSNHEISIGELLDLAASLLGVKVSARQEQSRMRPAKSEVRRLVCDNRKLAAKCGFQPSIPLRDGLERTARWFRDSRNLTQYKTDLYNV
jgi:NAD dependent epimerase/dehydratase